VSNTVEQFPDAIKTSLKETSLAGSKIYHRRLGIEQQRHQAVCRFRSAASWRSRLHPDLPDHVVITPSRWPPWSFRHGAFSFAGAFGLSVLVWRT